MLRAILIAMFGIPCAFGLSLTACRSGSDSDLETMEYAINMISLDGPAAAHIVDEDNIVVEGPATNRDKFQHDVFFTATLWDANGKSIATATGKLEDWPAGHHGIYKLVGTAPTATWTRVTVVVSKVTEHVQGHFEY